MEKNSKIFVAGHKGMVGSSILRTLLKNGYSNIITKNKDELDLRNQSDVANFFRRETPEYVINASAKVGGIAENANNPAIFLYDNLMIQNNLIHNSHINKVKKIILLGSSCIYPRETNHPIKEEYLLTGELEKTNEGYALAKICGLKLLDFYHKQYGLKGFSLMPCNLYGPNDNFDLQKSHVLSALVRKFIDAIDNNNDEVIIWGTGIAKREFMHVDDLSSAVIHFFDIFESGEYINIGWGEDISIKELANIISIKTKFKGKITFDITKPDGTIRKCMDVSKMKKYEFEPKITLENGIKEMIDIYKKLKYR